MKKMIATFFVLFLLEGAGNLMNGVVDIVTLNTHTLKTARVSLDAHQAEYEQGNDPSAMAVTG